MSAEEQCKNLFRKTIHKQNDSRYYAAMQRQERFVSKT